MPFYEPKKNQFQFNQFNLPVLYKKFSPSTLIFPKWSVATLNIASIDDQRIRRRSAQHKLGTYEAICSSIEEALEESRKHEKSIFEKNDIKKRLSSATKNTLRKRKRNLIATKESDKIETAKSRFTVVSKAPVFTEEMTSAAVYEKSDLQLRCSVKGRNLGFHWHRNRSKLQFGNRINFDYSDEMRVSTLVTITEFLFSRH
ncbi:hypothetical protein ACOME3_010075 [Neoechinorhynchus agilis]